MLYLIHLEIRNKEYLCDNGDKMRVAVSEHILHRNRCGYALEYPVEGICQTHQSRKRLCYHESTTGLECHSFEVVSLPDR